MSRFRLTLVGNDGYNSEVVNVFHYETTVLGIAYSYEDLAGIFATQAEATWEALVGAGTQATLISIRDIDDPEAGHDMAIAWEGAASGEALAPQLAGHITFRAAGFGRRGRGGTFLPSPTESQNQAGAPTTTYKEGLTNWFEAIQNLDDLGFTRAVLCVYSRVDDTMRQVVTATPSTLWGDLDRRKPGRGS